MGVGLGEEEVEAAARLILRASRRSFATGETLRLRTVPKLREFLESRRNDSHHRELNHPRLQHRFADRQRADGANSGRLGAPARARNTTFPDRYCKCESITATRWLTG
jgi:hypothetical protein